MHKELWQQLIKLDRQETARRAKCQYLSDPERYIVTLLNSQCVVNLVDSTILIVQSDSQQVTADYLSQLCLLAYLINAKDLPLTDKLVKAESLPGGLFFFRGHHELPTQKLEKTFGENPRLLYDAAARLNAVPCEFGDASIKLFVLPRIPLTFIVWAADEQFAARASILFDQTASKHLPLDAILVVVTLAVNAIIKSVCQIN